MHAVDVGTNQLAWKIRSDRRVKAQEQFNARNLEPKDVDHDPIDLVVIDVSFISLTKILPAAFRVLSLGGQMVCLIKPQFELAKDEIGKGGIVRDEFLREKAIAKVRGYVQDEAGQEWIDLVPSSIKGTDGNQEYLAYLRKISDLGSSAES